MGEPSAPPGQETWLSWLPLPALILAADGSAVAVNPTWATVLGSGVDGWLDVVEQPFRAALGERLRLAAAAREPGRADCWVTGPGGGRWSRWWWHPAPPRNLLVCVGVIGDGQAGASEVSISTGPATPVTDQILAAGVALESAASMLDGPMAAMVLRVLDDLERLIEQIHSAAIQQPPSVSPPSPEEQ
jgi:hypothetical protein